MRVPINGSAEVREGKCEYPRVSSMEVREGKGEYPRFGRMEVREGKCEYPAKAPCRYYKGYFTVDYTETLHTRTRKALRARRVENDTELRNAGITRVNNVPPR